MLAVILAGYVADPPGVQFYYQSPNPKGEPAFDEHGIPLLDCDRGTNDVENSYKQIVTTFGTWCTGAEMVECLLAMRRHRYNLPQRILIKINFHFIGLCTGIIITHPWYVGAAAPRLLEVWPLLHLAHQPAAATRRGQQLRPRVSPPCPTPPTMPASWRPSALPPFVGAPQGCIGTSPVPGVKRNYAQLGEKLKTITLEPPLSSSSRRIRSTCAAAWGRRHPCTKRTSSLQQAVSYKDFFCANEKKTM